MNVFSGLKFRIMWCDRQYLLHCIAENEENAEKLEECTVCHVDDMKDGE